MVELGIDVVRDFLRSIEVPADRASQRLHELGADLGRGH